MKVIIERDLDDIGVEIKELRQLTEELSKIRRDLGQYEFNFPQPNDPYVPLPELFLPGHIKSQEEVAADTQMMHGIVLAIHSHQTYFMTLKFIQENMLHGILVLSDSVFQALGRRIDELSAIECNEIKRQSEEIQSKNKQDEANLMSSIL